MSSPSLDRAATQLMLDADACVKCGLCLPHCPTYRETEHEGDSPRGRIALLQGFTTGLIPLTHVLERHLDGCLSCRRCEVVCPADVDYSRVLDAGRAALGRARPARLVRPRMLSALLASRAGPWLLRLLPALLRATGALALARRLGSGLARTASFASAAAAMAGQRAPKMPTPGPRVAGLGPIGLFRGCVTSALERDALGAATTLLTAVGYDVRSPRDATCCGALAQHAGLPEAYRAQAGRNLAAFSGLERIATITSGCASALCDARDAEGKGATDFADRVRDLGAWLLPHTDRLNFVPLNLRAALHVPCTLQNVMGGADATRALLRRIPGLELVELDPESRCCGAAGTYCFDQPAMADRLLARKLDAVRQLRPDLVISSNVGCTLHLLAGLERAGLRSPAVRHPASVLAAQLQGAVRPQAARP